MKKKNNIIFIIFIIVIVVALGVVIFLAINSRKSTDTIQSNQELSTEETEKWQEGTITYNGDKYRYNTAIKTYLFLGIDREGVVKEAEDGISGGQSDAMYLLVEDTKAKKMSIIAIHRNAMAMVDVYDKDSKYIGQQKLQICLQHGYGDGMRTSCLRSVDAVSRLFYKLPISGYMSLRMEAVPMLNDAVGGVQVIVLEDLENKSLGVSLKEGEEVTLAGNEAYVYLRKRDIEEFDSATNRIKRQQQYLINFMSKAKAKALEGEKAVAKIYDSISDYLVSSIDFVDLALESKDYSFDASNMYTLPGEVVMGEKFEEFIVDDEALYKMIIEIFYERC